MNVIVEKRLAELSSRPRAMWFSLVRVTRRELQAVPAAIRWLFGIDR